uniref:Uncharacterized protein n=1 Tax=Cynoglossus semilaevis TaxID=244447 RepID=A0A3P8V1J1_CYNSE
MELSVALLPLRTQNGISLGSLLFFSDQVSSAHTSNCVSADKPSSRLQRFLSRYTTTTPPPSRPNKEKERTCAEAAKRMSGDVSARSLSPWRIRVDSDENRVPRVIAFAECLCQGCIVNRHEDLGYNSVPIMVWKKVLRKIPCPTDKDKYTVTRETVEVPVACACVKPNAAK